MLVVSTIIFVSKHEQLNLDMTQELRKMWLIAANSKDGLLKRWLLWVETNFGMGVQKFIIFLILGIFRSSKQDCCGFYNALDYCCVSQVSKSIPKFMDEYNTWLKVRDQETNDDYGFIDSNTSSTDYGSYFIDESSAYEKVYDTYGTYENVYENEFTQSCTPTDNNEYCVCKKLEETGRGLGSTFVFGSLTNEIPRLYDVPLGQR